MTPHDVQHQSAAIFRRTRLASRHPEAIRMDDDLATFAEPDGTVQLFDAASVARPVSLVIPPGAE
jgi:hypothetical protein